jgi:F-type H+-transporting ATPase subunit gamma
MATTREIRRRIRGVNNIKQVTRAMNMIAAARLRRAQSKAESARPYAERILEIFRDVVSGGGIGARHPLLAKREVRRIGIVLITSDRGLAGPFNANINREAAQFIAQQQVDVGLITVGKKGRDHFRNRGLTIDEHFSQPSRDVTLDEVEAISKRVITGYTEGHYDQVFLVYSNFVSVLKATAEVVQLLPLEAAKSEDAKETAKSVYQFEPAAEEMLDTLLPQYIEVVIHRGLVESLASEQAARMVAMKTATDSASDMIDRLTRDYNRVRQASITKEILEVVSGAAALEESHG